MNKMTIMFRILGYAGGTMLVMLLIIAGKQALCATPFVVALAVLLSTVTVSDRP